MDIQGCLYISRALLRVSRALLRVRGGAWRVARRRFEVMYAYICVDMSGSFADIQSFLWI